jgi:hypothetical protein
VFTRLGYPLKLINGEYKRALDIDRKDLIFSSSTKKKKKHVVAQLIITFSPAKPNVRRWIFEELPTLHEDPKLKKVLPKIEGEN